MRYGYFVAAPALREVLTVSVISRIVYVRDSHCCCKMFTVLKKVHISVHHPKKAKLTIRALIAPSDQPNAMQVKLNGKPCSKIPASAFRLDDCSQVT